MLETVAVTCFIFCFGAVDDQPQAPVSDFCQRYERQVLSKQDANEVKRLPKDLQRRLQGNDVDYLCLCRKWNNPVCSLTPRSESSR